MNNTFSATELSTTIGILKQFLYNTGANSITSSVEISSHWISRISELVKSEDSNLSATCENLSTTLNLIKSKIESVYDSILTEFTNYASETLANESVTTQSLDEIFASLKAIQVALASI